MKVAMGNLKMAGLIFIFIAILSACQKKVADEKATQIQESVERIKAKIEESFSDDNR
jgi:hypothetical protein